MNAACRRVTGNSYRLRSEHDLHRLDFGLLAAQHYAFADRPVEEFPLIALSRLFAGASASSAMMSLQHADQPIRPFVFAAHGLTSFRWSHARMGTKSKFVKNKCSIFICLQFLPSCGMLNKMENMRRSRVHYQEGRR